MVGKLKGYALRDKKMGIGKVEHFSQSLNQCLTLTLSPLALD